MLIEITVGDWCNDGHGRSDRYFYDINLNSDQELRAAYNKGAKLLDIPLDRLCRGYQDSYFPRKPYNELVALGLPDECEYYYSEDENGKIMTPDVYVEAYMIIAKAGNPELEYSIITADSNVIHIGGYGLYD